ncbi:hypothetical protein KEJ26_00290 [Candidatus Bathyarchaeota archaeon]|nr:hypothetical protein [Candidatus Bathyarchaeota archaeon]
MNPNEYEKDPLWKILVDTVHALLMYPHHKAYVRDVLLPEKPEISPEDLALKLGIPLGEALVILYELKTKK